jgi:undecaprenyl-diphosphatase
MEVASSAVARAALIVLVGFGAVLGVALAVWSGLSDPLDDAVISVVRADAARPALGFLRPLTEAGSTWAVTGVAVALMGSMILLGLPWTGLAAGFTILAASLLNTMAKSLVARARPELLEPIVVERGFSFPSGHAALGMVTWGIVAVVVARSRLPRALRATLVLGLGALVALIGISRIYLGVHYPTDVLAGWVAGGSVVLLFGLLTRDVSSVEWRSPGGGPAAADRGEPRSDRSAQG